VPPATSVTNLVRCSGCQLVPGAGVAVRFARTPRPGAPFATGALALAADFDPSLATLAASATFLPVEALAWALPDLAVLAAFFAVVTLFDAAAFVIL
jgi:hypothetical protein